MKKYTQAEIKKFLDPETRFHMSAHVIQTEAVEMCRQLQAEREILVEALKQYAKSENWAPVLSGKLPEYRGPLDELRRSQRLFVLNDGNAFEIASIVLKEVGEI